MLRFIVVSGDPLAVSARRSELLDECGWSGEVIDVSDDGGGGRLLAAVRTVSMFASPRVVAVESAERLSVADAAALAAAAAHSTTTVVARAAAKLNAKVLTHLAAVVHLEQADARGGAQRRARQLAEHQGVHLDSGALTALIDCYGDDIERARTALWQLAVAGKARPSAADVTAVSAPVHAAGVPWAPLDALAAGNLAGALAAAAAAEPAAVLTLVARDVLAAARIVEAAAGTASDAQRVLGGNRWAAERAWKLAQRLGAGGVRRALVAVMDAQLAMRSGHDPAGVLTVALADVLGPFSGAGGRR
jgi:DNA polymerase III delta subunit